MTQVTVRQDRTQLHVSSPYDPAYVAGVKALGGRWSPEARTWTVPLHERDQLRELLLRVYKVDGGLPAPAPGPKPGSRLPTCADLDRLLAELVVEWAPAAAQP